MVKPVGRRLAYALVLGLAVAGFGCSDSGETTAGGSAGSTGSNSGTGGTTPPVAGAAQTITIVSGDGQSGAPSGTLALPLIVKVADANGVGVSGVSVEFFTEGTGGAGISGGLLTSTVTTGSDGQANVSYKLGSFAGIYNILGRVPSLSNASVSFKATATTGVADPALLATVAVGSLPQGINLNPTTNKIYVGNNGNKNGCDYAVFSNATSTTMTVIDGVTNTPTSVTVGDSPIYPVANTSLNRIYVANSGTGSVTVLNGANNQVIATTTGLGAVHQPAVDTTTDEVWVNDSSGNRAIVINGTTNAVLGFVATGQRGPHGLAIHAGRNRVYTTNVEDKTVTEINSAALLKVRDIGPFSADALGIAVNMVTDKIYVGTAIGQKIVIIDAVTGAFSELNIGRHVLEIAVDETRNRIYATSQTMPYSVAVINGATDTLLGFHPVGTCPWGVAINPTTNRLYVGNQGENTVTVLDASQLP